MIAKYTMSPVFDKSGALNNAYKINAFNTVPDKIHGLNFPYFVSSFPDALLHIYFNFNIQDGK